MSVRRAIVLIIGAIAAGGCAGGRTTQDVGRLKSDVGLLEERVSQLERASLSQAANVTWPTEPAAQPETMGTTPSAMATVAAKPSKTEIQQALKNAGFYQGPIDGKIGPLTREAIQKFQEVNGLKVDGVVGKHTWEKLSLYLGEPAASEDVGAAEPIK